MERASEIRVSLNKSQTEPTDKCLLAQDYFLRPIKLPNPPTTVLHVCFSPRPDDKNNLDGTAGDGDKPRRKRLSAVPVIEIDDFVEQKRSARCAREPGADQLVTVGQVRVASGASVQPVTTDMVEEYPAHSRSDGSANGAEVFFVRSRPGTTDCVTGFQQTYDIPAERISPALGASLFSQFRRRR